jgi:hypothetical protein
MKRWKSSPALTASANFRIMAGSSWETDSELLHQLGIFSTPLIVE